MKELTKELVLKQVKSLYNTYKNGKIQHSTKNCKLCQIYLSGEYRCTTCLNKAFYREISSFSYYCLGRGDDYKQLNFLKNDDNDDNNNNNIHLYHFWKEVYEMLLPENENDILSLEECIKEKKILNIAEKYK